MRTIFISLILVFSASLGFSQSNEIQSTDYVVEVSSDTELVQPSTKFRYASVVSKGSKVIILKTSEDKSSFALKELKKAFPAANVTVVKGDQYLSRTQESEK